MEKMIPGTLRTACGRNVLVNDQTREHLAAHPEAFTLLEDAVSRVTLPTDRSFLAREVDMGRVIGLDGVVETDRVALGEETTFAMRPNRAKASRVAVGVASPETSKFVVLAFAAQESEDYVLVTGFKGSLSTKEPWDPNVREDERAAAVEYWCTHALVHDANVMGAPFQSSWEQILTS